MKKFIRWLCHFHNWQNAGVLTSYTYGQVCLGCGKTRTVWYPDGH